ncbi:MAG: redox-sensing transcriptional repressor Rex [Parasporobacterium sp.]|nr:redox-sensing transcriptional repressor Rex [Parasporobacterium sp.]
MNNKNNISKAVISRLPRYYRFLRDLMDQGVERISSEELSRLMKATASQIRQDLNHFGGFGQQGYGYNVKSLYNEIGKILGVEEAHNIIVIGAGNLARALVKYNGFSQHGFNFCSLFDIDGALCGKSVNGVRIRAISEIEDYIKTRSVDIAALTIPMDEAMDMSDRLYKSGVRYFWNFTNMDLELPEDAIVKDVHLLDTLLELSYRISSGKKTE